MIQFSKTSFVFSKERHSNNSKLQDAYAAECRAEPMSRRLKCNFFFDCFDLFAKKTGLLTTKKNPNVSFVSKMSFVLTYFSKENIKS